MNFKEHAIRDLNIFFSLDEFGELHDIDGKEVVCVLDENVLKERPREPVELYRSSQGIYVNSKVLFVRKEDLATRPVVGQHMRVDGELYLISECSESHGVLEITLEANEA